MPGAPRHPAGPEASGLRSVDATGSPVSLRDLPQGEVFQLLVGDQALELRVLALELLQPLDVVALHPSVLGTPAVIGRLGDLQRLTDLWHLDAVGQHLVGLSELPDDLLRRVSSALHVIGPPLAHSPWAEGLSHEADRI